MFVYFQYNCLSKPSRLGGYNVHSIIWFVCVSQCTHDNFPFVLRTSYFVNSSVMESCLSSSVYFADVLKSHVQLIT